MSNVLGTDLLDKAEAKEGMRTQIDWEKFR